MYNLLIVDDEKIERNGIVFLLNKFNISVGILEASNGKQAMDMLRSHSVRIVITDIRMPIMDGLELARSMCAEFPDVKIIIYSAYGEFEYARQAIEFGTFRYLLKPIKIDEFQEVIDAVLKQCEEDDAQKETIEDFNRQHLLQASLKTVDNDALHEAAIDWIGKQPFPAYLLLVQSRDNFIAQKGAELKALFEKSIDMPHLSLNLTENQTLYFLFPGKKLPDARVSQLAEKLLQKTKQAYGDSLLIIVSDAVDSPAGIPDAYHALGDAEDYSFFMRDGCVILSGKNYFTHKSGMFVDHTLLDCIYEDAAYGDFAKLKKDLALLTASMQQNNSLSHLYVKNIFITLFGKLHSWTALLPEQEAHAIIKEIVNSSHIDQLILYVHSQLTRLESLSVLDSGNPGLAQTVQQVMKIIHQKYEDTSLSLKYLAEQVYLTPNYLSCLFRKEAGLGISKYICQYRLDKARQLLLTTNMKVSDIGIAVGFSSDSYFVTLFGSQYGQSPSRYRENYKRKQGND